MIKNCTAIILAGGESKRMGEDKAQVVLNGKRLLDHTLLAVKPLFDNVIISSKRSRFHHNEVEILDMVTDCQGPIVGIVSAMAHSPTEWVFVTACDMPFIKSSLIQHFCNQRNTHYDCIVPIINDKAQPLFALYRKPAALAVLLECSKTGHCSLIRNMQDRLKTLWINQEQITDFDPQLSSFIDIDTKTELNRYKLS